MPTTGPRTILAPGEYVTPSGCVYRALVRVRVGEPGNRHTPPSPHEPEGFEPGSVTYTTLDGRRHAIGDLAVSRYTRTRIETIALSRLPAPGAPQSAWERWHEEHGTP